MTDGVVYYARRAEQPLPQAEAEAAAVAASVERFRASGGWDDGKKLERARRLVRIVSESGAPYAVKIGCSRDPQTREGAGRLVIAVEEPPEGQSARELEKERHNQFGETRREYTETFFPSPELVSHIRELPRPHYSQICPKCWEESDYDTILGDICSRCGWSSITVVCTICDAAYAARKGSWSYLDFLARRCPNGHPAYSKNYVRTPCRTTP